MVATEERVETEKISYKQLGSYSMCFLGLFRGMMRGWWVVEMTCLGDFYWEVHATAVNYWAVTIRIISLYINNSVAWNFPYVTV